MQDQDKNKVVSVWIKGSLYTKIKIQAAETNKTVSAVVESALVKEAKAYEKQKDKAIQQRAGMA